MWVFFSQSEAIQPGGRDWPSRRHAKGSRSLPKTRPGGCGHRCEPGVLPLENHLGQVWSTLDGAAHLVTADVPDDSGRSRSGTAQGRLACNLVACGSASFVWAHPRALVEVGYKPWPLVAPPHVPTDRVYVAPVSRGTALRTTETSMKAALRCVRKGSVLTRTIGLRSDDLAFCRYGTESVLQQRQGLVLV